MITDDDVDRISLCVRVVAERVPLMKNIFTVECRNSLSSMLDANKKGEEQKLNKVGHLFTGVVKILCVSERSRMFTVGNLGSGTCFSKVAKLFGSISVATLLFISLKLRVSKPSNFTILFVFRT